MRNSQQQLESTKARKEDDVLHQHKADWASQKARKLVWPPLPGRRTVDPIKKQIVKDES